MADCSIKDYYDGLCSVPEEMLPIRERLLAIRPPRKLLLQPELYLKGDSVEIMEYPKTLEGFIQSYLHHFQQNAQEVDAIFSRYRRVMKYKPQPKE